MKVDIKSLEVEMPVKKNGIELEVRSTDGKTQLGDLYVTMTGLTWCKGRKTKVNGVKADWNKVQEIFASDAALDAAHQAAKAVTAAPLTKAAKAPKSAPKAKSATKKTP